MTIKVINAGKCMLCGKPIELDDTKDTDKLPNIFFCPECEKKAGSTKVKMMTGEGRIENEINY